MISAINAGTLNAFLEDTCVLVAIGFVIVRGRLFDALFGPDATPWLAGGLFGMLGATEYLLPGGRDPYALDTLAVVVSMLAVGWRASLLTALISAAGAIATLPLHDASPLAGIASAYVVALGVSRLWPNSPVYFLTAGVVAQGASAATIELLDLRPDLPAFLATSFANGFGAWLLALVLRDARTRQRSAEIAAEGERIAELARGAQIAALRARLKPHFLFNTLNSIAALSEIDPRRARQATLNLSQLMRAALATDAGAKSTLEAELAAVRAYAGIEAERFGDRLSVSYEIEPNLSMRLPAFGIQLLVENAVVHGLGRQRGKVHIRVVVRRAFNGFFVAVQDDGMGTDKPWRKPSVVHGLQVLDEQLVLEYGEASRIRFFSRPGKGTVVAYRLLEVSK